MSACHSCDYYSARDRWCSALEDRVIRPDLGRCSAHSEDACGTCGVNDEEQCDACAFGAGENEPPRHRDRPGDRARGSAHAQ